MAAPWSSGAKVRLIGKLQGQDCINVLHFATNTVINDPQALAALLTQLAVAMLACAVDNLPGAVTSDYILHKVEASQIHPVVGDAVEAVPAGGGMQGLLSPVSVSFIATLIGIRTGLGGRSKRGRIFLPPVGETETTASTINGGTIPQIQAFLDCVAGKFIGAGATEPWRVGVFSRKLAGAGNDFNAGFTEALNLVVSPDVACMKSRKVGRGN